MAFSAGSTENKPNIPKSPATHGIPSFSATTTLGTPPRKTGTENPTQHVSPKQATNPDSYVNPRDRENKMLDQLHRKTGTLPLNPLPNTPQTTGEEKPNNIAENPQPLENPKPLENTTNNKLDSQPPTKEQSPKISLENTNIANAVIEGDIQKYQQAIQELSTFFNISIHEILNKQTSNGKTLDILMITPKQNQEYFATELIHLLTMNTIRSLNKEDVKHEFSHETSIIDNHRNKINELIKIAQEAKNQTAIKLLEDFDIITTKMLKIEAKRITEAEQAFSVAQKLQTDLEKAEQAREEQLNWTKEVLSIVQNPKYNVSLTGSGVLRLLISAALGVVGVQSAMYVLSPSNIQNQMTLLEPSLWSVKAGPKLAEWAVRFLEIHITPDLATLALGTALFTGGALSFLSGVSRCAYAFRKSNRINNIQNKINKAPTQTSI